MISDFVINGYSQTAAESYAEISGLKFVDLGTQEREASGELFDYNVFKKGDVNLDGKIDIDDVTLIQKWLADYEELSAIQRCNAIVCESYSKINIDNATDIQKYIAGLIYSLEGSAAG